MAQQGKGLALLLLGIAKKKKKKKVGGGLIQIHSYFAVSVSSRKKESLCD